MEEMEQPNIENIGSNEGYGKFKDAESLLKAYTNLEAEFTKKSQKLKALETEQNERIIMDNRRAEIERKVGEFATKFEIIKPFSSALKESMIADENLDIAETAMDLVQKNYKRAEDYAKDDEFLNNYIFSNQEIKDKIVKDYLSKVAQNSPIKMDLGSGNIPLTPPNIPTTIAEAGRLAKSIIKQK